MTCIGQRKPAILPEYVHMLCTHQSVQQNFSVRSKSYSAVYFDSRGYFAFMDLYSTAEAIFYVTAAFGIYFGKCQMQKIYKFYDEKIRKK